MPGPDDSLEARLLATFKIEAREIIQAMAASLAILEKAPSAWEQPEAIESVFRSAHSLKGAARAVNSKDIESLCHSMESVFTGLKRREIAAPPALFDLFYRALDALDALLRRLDPGQGAVEKPDVTELVGALELAISKKPSSQTSERATAPPVRETSVTPIPKSGPPDREARLAATETVRVAAQKLDAMLLQAAELIPAGMAASQHAGRLRELGERFSEWRRAWTRIRPAIRGMSATLDAAKESREEQHLSRLIEFVDWNQQFVENVDRQLTEIVRTADRDQRSLATMVDGLLEEASKVAMQPFSTVLNLFPRFVRDLSRDENKDVDLVIQGAELEIDRRILEELKDPLIHLIRNSLDHGIESPADRVKKGKPPRGAITIFVSARDGSSVELLVSDDGAGIDLERLKSAAVKEGLLSAERAQGIADQDALQLIFQSGATTSPIITDLSGRGLGLAITREKVTALSGAIFVESHSGQGTVFRIVLPMTLARFRGVLVQARESLFMLPTAGIDRVVPLRAGSMATVENRETITVSEKAVSLVHLADVLALPAAVGLQSVSPHSSAVVITSDGERIAFAVDAVLGEQEILVKPLGPQLTCLPHFAGATVLASGTVVPILYLPELAKRARQAAALPATNAISQGHSEIEEAGAVLVAEDSITSRTLLKNILETAGYRVETAIDGIDAFTKLRSSSFDLVVSDVDMPRMNGFGLTAKIRNDKQLAELPVILVTSLDSPKDREHGIDVGANAYIIKSSFDQTNLLEVVRRLI
jgi:two-component system chemotaxis sensor kinase CheA